MRKIVAASVVLLVLSGCLLAVGCDGLDSTATTLPSGGTATGDTLGTTGTTLGTVETAPPVGGTPLPDSSDGTLLGRWYNSITGYTIEFLPDGTVLGTIADRVGSTVYYTISGNEMSLSVDGIYLLTQTFSIDGDTLTIVDTETGESGTMQRVQ